MTVLLLNVTDTLDRQVLIPAKSILKMTDMGDGTTMIMLAPSVYVVTKSSLAELAESIGPHHPHRPF